ncbi:hypothetical protein BDV96DRAFT_609315 [Lophiotrema nucula]|uniref:Uncharacterized protein n=1 Tax=Lophiotrema nucula TaxID=690887 RepID=A0A6A5ZNS1_9PLEO|nr:hypothetical protein BDV96DRAFT_609315 [Lophiotrema nucula]
MPLPKRQVIPSKAGPSRDRSKKDTRFANFETDPRFRLPSRKSGKVKLDSRFDRLLTDVDFFTKASVDKYGRKVEKDAGRKEIEKRFYQEDEDEDEDESGEDEEVGHKDRAVKKELAKVDKRGPNYDPIRDGGFSESSSDEYSSDEGEDEEEDVEEQAELPAEANDVPTGDVTSRLAVVNMDWDNVRAADLMAVANSFIPATGRILSVTIYPSEFGRERLQREEIEGPPREIFASSTTANQKDIDDLDDPEEASESEVDEEEIKKDLLKEGGGEEFDSKALRAYQLDRLRYYYAVITCSSVKVAKAIYDNMDGREYLSSANFFDLRFVPDDTTFDEDPHDECERLPDAYKPNEFTTDALTHSKVKLTWDADDTTRKEAQKRAFSQKEIDENDLQAYLGTDSSSGEEEEDSKSTKAAALRKALGLGATEAPSKPKSGSKRDRDFEKPAGEMEVTFTAGLSNAVNGSVFENEPILNETSIEKYVRLQKEHKARRKERAKARREGRDPDAVEGAEEPNSTKTAEDPWNDPFFDSNPEAAKALEREEKKSKKQQKREEREKAEKQSAEERAQLELLMVDDEGSKVQHFDMNDIIKSEKAKKKSKKHKDKPVAVVNDDFKLDVTDPRFAKLYESHEYAIDPTNPKYKSTEGMKALLEEGRKKRKRHTDDGEPVAPKKSKKQVDVSGDADDLKKLAARVKAKSKNR